MTSVPDDEPALIADFWPGIIEQPRSFCEGGQHIELRERIRRALDGLETLQNLLTHLEEQLVFQLRAAFLRAEDLALHLFQLGRDETLAVGHRLLADVMW